MSGNFVQRGEAACANKQIRAEDAVKNGAEVVLEIPFPYCSMTAEKFARAGVDILAKSGMCSHIAFGSECADVKKLEKIAEFLISEQTKSSIQVYQSKNPSISYAVARTEIIKQALGEEYASILTGSNDILGVEYIKAIKLGNYDLIPVAIKRTVDRKDSANADFASSSHIRELLKKGETATAVGFVPDGSLTLEDFSRHTGFYEVLHTSLMTKSADELGNICEISGGLEYSVLNAAKESENYSQTVESLKCKTLTDAKIRRMLLFAFLGVTKEIAEMPVEYTLILANSQNEKALSLLRASRKNKQITVAHRVSEIRKNPVAFRQYAFCSDAERVLFSTDKLSLK